MVLTLMLFLLQYLFDGIGAQCPWACPTAKRIGIDPSSLTCDFASGFCAWDNNGANSDEAFRRISGPTPSSNTGPSSDHTTGSGRYAYMEASAMKYSQVSILEATTGITVEANSYHTCHMVFFYAMIGATVDRLQIQYQILEPPSNSWVTLFSATGDQGAQWNGRSVVIPTGFLIRLRVKAKRGVSVRGDIAIDDLSFSVGCLRDAPLHSMVPTSAVANAWATFSFQGPEVVASDQVLFIPLTSAMQTDLDCMNAAIPSSATLYTLSSNLSTPVLFRDSGDYVLCHRGTGRTKGAFAPWHIYKPLQVSVSSLFPAAIPAFSSNVKSPGVRLESGAGTKTSMDDAVWGSATVTAAASSKSYPFSVRIMSLGHCHSTAVRSIAVGFTTQTRQPIQYKTEDPVDTNLGSFFDVAVLNSGETLIARPTSPEQTQRLVSVRNSDLPWSVGDHVMLTYFEAQGYLSISRNNLPVFSTSIEGEVTAPTLIAPTVYPAVAFGCPGASVGIVPTQMASAFDLPSLRSSLLPLQRLISTSACEHLASPCAQEFSIPIDATLTNITITFTRSIPGGPAEMLIYEGHFQPALLRPASPLATLRFIETFQVPTFTPTNTTFRPGTIMPRLIGGRRYYMVLRNLNGIWWSRRSDDPSAPPYPETGLAFDSGVRSRSYDHSFLLGLAQMLYPVTQLSKLIAVAGQPIGLQNTNSRSNLGDRLNYVANGESCSNSSAQVGVARYDSTAGPGTTMLSVQFTFRTPGVFHLCYYYAVNKMLISYQQSTMSVVYISHLSVSSIIFNTTTPIKFTGFGLARYDAVKFVPSSATVDTDCGVDADFDAAGTGLQFLSPTTATSAPLILRALNAGLELKLCYRFGLLPFRLYPSITLTVRRVTSLSGHNTSNFAVISPRTVTVMGVGISAGDKAKWVLYRTGDSSDCAYAAQGGAGKVRVSASLQATFLFSLGGKDLRLCYKFLDSKQFTLFPNIVANVHRITGLNPSSAVVGVARPLFVAGTLHAPGDTIRFAPAGSLSDSACLDQPDIATLVGRVAMVKFASAGIGRMLCYRFSVMATFHLYHGISIDVYEVSGVDTTTAVVGVPQTLTLFGTGIAVQRDLVKWVPSMALSCKESNSDAQGGIGAVEVGCGGIVVVNFKTSEPRFGVWNTCYKFGPSEPFVLYPFQLRVSSLQSVSVTRMVVGVPQIIRFNGSNFQPGTDIVRWVDSGATRDGDCAGSSVTGSHITQSSGNLYSSSSQLNVSFSRPGLNLRLCFQFGSRPFALYPTFVLSIHTVEALAATFDIQTPITFSVVGVPQSAIIRGTGISSDVSTPDLIKWVAAAASMDSDCLTMPSVGPVLSANPVGRVKMVFSSPGLGLKLCYRFPHLPYKLYSSIQLNVAQLSHITASTGSDTVARVGFQKLMTFHGFGLSSGDRIKFVAASGGCGAGADFAEGGLGEVSLSPNLTTLLLFKEPAVAVQLCYQFGDNPYIPFPQFNMTVTTAVGISPTSEVIGREVSFHVFGSGFSSSDVAKLVPPTAGCSSALFPAIAVNWFEDTSEISFSLSLTKASRYELCYRFGLEPWTRYSALTVASLEVVAVSPSFGPTDSPLAVKFSGVVGSGHHAKWVHHAIASSSRFPCGINTTTTAPVSVNDGIGIFQFLPTDRGFGYSLCFEFNSEGYVHYPQFMLDIGTVVNSNTTHSLMGDTQYISLHGFALTTGDRAKFVKVTTGSTSADCSGPAVSTVAQLSTFNTALHQQHSFSVVGRFTFLNGSTAAALCYQFKNSSSFSPFIAVSMTVMEATGVYPTIALPARTTNFTIFGFDLQVGDSVKWLPSAIATSDASCSLGQRPGVYGPYLVEEGGSPPPAKRGTSGARYSPPPARTRATFTSQFLHPPAINGSLRLCYRSAMYARYKLFPRIELSLMVIRRISPPRIVVGQVTSLVVEGSRSVDKMKFVPAVHGDCQGVVGALGGGLGLISAAEFPSGIPLIADSPAVSLRLCYQHTPYDFLMYPAITLDIVQVLDVSPSQFRTNTSTQLSFSGIGIHAGDLYQLVPFACGANVAFSGAVQAGGLSEVLHFQNTSVFFICYKFLGTTTGFVPFEALTVEVRAITSMQPVVAYRGTPVQIQLQGGFPRTSQATPDTAKFVLTTSTCADPPVAGSSSFSVHLAFPVFTFERPGNFSLCYRFGLRPFVFYSALVLEVQPKLVHTMPQFVQTGKLQQLNYSGAAIPGHRVNYVPLGTNLSFCDFDTGLMRTLSSHNIVSMGGSRATVTFSSAGKWSTCYDSGGGFHFVPGLILTSTIVTTLANYPVASVSKLPLLVAGKTNTLKISGIGIALWDQVKFVSTGTVANAFECESAVSALGIAVETVTADHLVHVFVPLLEGGNNISSSAALADHILLCYRFNQEPSGGRWSFFPGLGATVVRLTFVAPVIGPALSSYTMFFSGYGISSADTARWIPENFAQVPATDSSCLTNGVSSSLSLTNNASFLFQVTHTRIRLCYSYRGLPFQLTNITANAFVITSSSLVRTALSVPHIVRFAGTGLQPGDKIKYIKATSPGCGIGSANAENVGGEVSIRKFGAGIRGSKTTFVGASLEFRSFIQAAVTLCYSFQGSPYLHFPSVSIDLLPLAVHNISRSIALVGRRVSLRFQGVGLASGDRVKWVDAQAVRRSADNCGAGSSLALGTAGQVSSIGSAGVVDVVFLEGLKKNVRFWSLCYQFQSEPRFAFVPRIKLRVVSVAAVFPTAVEIEAPVTLSLVGDGLRAGDTLKWVAASSIAILESSSGRTTSCEASPPSGGVGILSAASSGIVANVTFTTTARTLQLCYKFQNDTVWTHFPAVTLHVQSTLLSVSSNSAVASGGVVLHISARGLELKTLYRCSFFGSSHIEQSVATRPQSSESLRCVTPHWLAVGGPCTLRITNGSHSVLGSVPFVFRPILQSATPSSGLGSGGTLLTLLGGGLVLDTHALRCIFTSRSGLSVSSEATTAATTQIVRCITPNWPHPAASTSVTLRYTVLASPLLPIEGSARFNFSEAVLSVSPLAGSAVGGFIVAVTATSLDSAAIRDYRCVFISAPAVAVASVAAYSSEVTPQSTTSLSCVAPPWFHAAGVVSVRLQRVSAAVMLVGSAAFDIRATIVAAYPTMLSAAGFDTVNIIASGLDTTQQYTCVFTLASRLGHPFLSSAVYPSNSTSLLCTTPQFTAPAAIVNISLSHSIRLVHGSVSASVFAILSGSETVSCPASGNCALALTVDGLHPTVPTNCVFTAHPLTHTPHSARSVSALPSSPSGFTCTAPAWLHTATTVSITLSALGLTVGGAVDFEYTAEAITTIPRVGISTGGANITVRGTGFGGPPSLLRCVFFRVDQTRITPTSAATALSSTELQCAPPSSAVNWLVRVTTDGGNTLSTASLEFKVYPSPNVIGLNPAFGRFNTTLPIHVLTCGGAQHSTVEGTPVPILIKLGDTTINLPCTFGKLILSGREQESLSCSIPASALPAAGAIPVRVSLNEGHDWTVDDVAFRSIGEESSLRVSSSSSVFSTSRTLPSAVSVPLGPFTVEAVDTLGATVALGSGSNLAVAVTCVRAGNPCPPGMLEGATTLRLAGGTVLFSTLALSAPAAAVYSLQFAAVGRATWPVATATVVIDVGPAVSIHADLAASPSPLRVTASTSLTAVRIQQRDAGGNLLTQSPPAVAFHFYLLGPVPPSQQAAAASANLTEPQLRALPSRRLTGNGDGIGGGGASLSNDSPFALSLGAPVAATYLLLLNNTPAHITAGYVSFAVHTGAASQVAVQCAAADGAAATAATAVYQPCPTFSLRAAASVRTPAVRVLALDAGGNAVLAFHGGARRAVRVLWVDSSGRDVTAGNVALTGSGSRPIVGDNSTHRHYRRELVAGVADLGVISLRQPSTGAAQLRFLVERITAAASAASSAPVATGGAAAAQRRLAAAGQLSFSADPSIPPPPSVAVNMSSGVVATGLARWAGSGSGSGSTGCAGGGTAPCTYTAANPVMLAHVIVTLADGALNTVTSPQPHYAGHTVTASLSEVPGAPRNQYLTAAVAATYPTHVRPWSLPSLFPTAALSAVTNSHGEARLTGLKLPQLPQGQYRLTLTISGLNSTTLPFRITPSAPYALQLLQGVSGAVEGKTTGLPSAPPLSPVPTLGIVDSYGNLVTSVAQSVLLSASVDHEPGSAYPILATPRIGGNTVQSTARDNGIAAFPALWFLGQWSRPYTVTFSATAGLSLVPATMAVTVRPCAALHSQPDTLGTCVCQQGYRPQDATAEVPTCVPCEQGLYGSEPGVCTPCPAHMATFRAVSTGVHHCECVENYYLETNGSCVFCGDNPGVFCPARTRGVHNVVVRRGFWRSSPETFAVYKCRIPGSNGFSNCLGTKHSLCAPVLSDAAEVPISASALNRSSSPPYPRASQMARYQHLAVYVEQSSRNEVPFALYAPPPSVAAVANLSLLPPTVAPVVPTADGKLVVPNIGGGAVSELQGSAAPGYYYGVMCELCSPGTGRNREVCQVCPPPSSNTGILFVYALLALTVVSAMVKSTMLAGVAKVEHENALQAKMHRHSAVELQLRQLLTGTSTGELANPKLLLTASAKIGINYMQLTSLAKQIDMAWPQEVAQMFTIQERFSSPTLQLSSVDCAIRAAVGPGVSTFFEKFKMMMSVPPLLLLSVAVFWYSWYLLSLTPHYERVADWLHARKMKARIKALRVQPLFFSIPSPSSSLSLSSPVAPAATRGGG